MLTKKEFNYIRGLIDSENQFRNILNEGYKNISETQLKENIQKFTASVDNHISLLLELLKGVDKC